MLHIITMKSQQRITLESAFSPQLSVSLTLLEGQFKECIGTLRIRQLNINDTTVIILIVLGNNYYTIIFKNKIALAYKM